MRMLSISVAAAVLAWAGAAKATELVTNGDFTQLTNGLGQITNGAGITTATGWSTTGYNLVMSVADQYVNTTSGPSVALWDKANGGASNWNGLAAGSGNFLALDGDFNTAAVTQTINGLTAGQKYDLTFDYAFAQQYTYSSPTQQNLTVSFGNQSVTLPATDYNLPNHGFSGWKPALEVFTATSSSEVLSFLAYGNLPVPPFALVSNVSLPASAPEPSTWAMMLVGFGGLGFLGYRRARKGVALAS
jgi:hypothetical protein